MISKLKAYDFTHTGFMKDGMQSVPLGNGEIGANVWIEADGGLRMLLSRIDALSEMYRLLKTGLYCLRLSPNPFDENTETHFTLSDAALTISAAGVSVRLYADMNAPCLRVSVASDAPVDVTVEAVNYRTEERSWNDDFSAFHLWKAPYTFPESADVTFSAPGMTGLYHHNRISCYRHTMETQYLQNAIGEDPMLNRIFGSAACADMENEDGKLVARGVMAQKFSLITISQPSTTPEKWLSAMNDLKDRHAAEPADAAEKSIGWWHKQWKKCYVLADGCDDAFAVSRAFLYQRYINLCAGTGEYPVKFNGSLFTCEQIKDEPGNYDKRNWGAPYWIQNTRLIYWGMLACGDYEQMKPLMRMFINLIPVGKERVRRYYNHEGMLLPETLTCFGTYTDHCYGYPNEKGERTINGNVLSRTPGESPNEYIRWHYNGMVEIAWLMLQYVNRSGDVEFLKDAIAFSKEVMLFFKEHFPQLDGRLFMGPLSSLETWQTCYNDTPDISGLTALADGILATGAADEETTALCEEIKRILPDMPMEMRSGRIRIAPCEVKVDTVPRNVENPELYPVFPYGQYRLGKPDLELARHTYRTRQFRHDGGWTSEPVQAALLGMTDEVKRHITRQSRMVDPRCIFPCFWGPNFDETPDQCHGGNVLITIAAMLYQSGVEDQVLPAWPADWNVEFRLAAPGNKFVRAEYRDGVLEDYDLEEA